MSIDKSTLDKKCFLGKKYSLQIAKCLIQDYPEISREYFSGKRTKDIVLEFDLCEKYDVGFEVAKSAVSYALRGYQGNIFENFEGLVQDKELLDKEGIEHRMKGARFSGNNALEQGKGIHGRSIEQRFIDSRIGVIAQGKKPWVQEVKIGDLRIPSELEVAIELSSLPEYQLPEGNNVVAISKKLNEIYHGGDVIRTPAAVKTQLRNQRIKNNIRKRKPITYWTQEEIDYCFQKVNTVKKSRLPNGFYQQICDELNEKFHEGKSVRTYGSVKTRILKLKKK